ncbi:MAG TPA: 3'-5' exonuclease, partial [Ignavibacteriales bacterium]|nr:3'-5' exonuclease [Ignavibacteriales bacterium]
MASSEIFILTAENRDVRGRNEIRIFGKSAKDGAVEVVIDNSSPVFFIERGTELDLPGIQLSRKETGMKSFSGEPVDAVYFRTRNDMQTAAETLREKRIRTYESDIDPVKRYLMERFINCQMHVEGDAVRHGKTLCYKNPKVKAITVHPVFSILSLDIETSGDGKVLYSIAVHLQDGGKDERKVFILGEEPESAPKRLSFHLDERKLLTAFFNWLHEADPDIIIGWHVIGFDLMFLDNKCRQLNMNFEIGRNKGRGIIKERKTSGYYAFVPGRVVIDGPFALRSSFYSFEDFKLETVAQELLGYGKLLESETDKIAEIEHNFKNDKLKLAEYNLQDAVLVAEIFEKTGLLELSIKRAQLSGLLLDNLGTMTAAFDHFMLPRLHRAGYAAPNLLDIPEGQYAPGGYVFDPKAGLYDNVGLFDFKSLYPSIMRTFKIDPFSRLMQDTDTITTPGGYKFSRTKNFLPDFIGKLMDLRAEAKKNKDAHLSQAIKILMNSF